MLADRGHASLRFTWRAASPSCLPLAALIVSIHRRQIDAGPQPITLYSSFPDNQSGCWHVCNVWNEREHGECMCSHPRVSHHITGA